jgi:hypothetical protein
VLLSAQKLDDPAFVAKAINERAQRIKALEAELASLPEEADAENLEGPKARMTADIARFRAMMSGRRNAPLARQVLRTVGVPTGIGGQYFSLRLEDRSPAGGVAARDLTFALCRAA